MTPDKRLDQIGPVLADVSQITDRLIESNGQILEVALRADTNAQIAARGVADLTIKMRQRFAQVDQQQIRIDERFGQVDQRFDQQQNQIDDLRTEMREGFLQVNQKFEQDHKLSNKS